MSNMSLTLIALRFRALVPYCLAWILSCALVFCMPWQMLLTTSNPAASQTVTQLPNTLFSNTDASAPAHVQPHATMSDEHGHHCPFHHTLMAMMWLAAAVIFVAFGYVLWLAILALPVIRPSLQPLGFFGGAPPIYLTSLRLRH